jgi:transcriptional regulator with XRE-family HTH domain
VGADSQSFAAIGERRLKAGQITGLALIEHLYLRMGVSPAQHQFEQHLVGDQWNRAFSLCDVGRPAVGTHVVPGDEISFESYNPPASWNAGYAIQRVRFGPKVKADFISHPGEELLIPERGTVAYHFFWSPGGSSLGRLVLSPAVSEGQILRANPQIPHHAWSVDGDAIAWVVYRHSMNSPIALIMEANSAAAVPHYHEEMWPRPNEPHALRHPHHRRMSATTLSRPGIYALVAWGISEQIREARLKAGLTPSDLAIQAGVDPSSISRLEDAKANISLEMLHRVCDVLRIGISHSMESGNWVCERNDIVPSRQETHTTVHVPRSSHFLHPFVLTLAKGERRIAPGGAMIEPGGLASWIVLNGRLLAELPESMGAKSMVLDAGNVLHFRRPGEILIRALAHSTIIRIAHSSICECNGVGSFKLAVGA